LPKDNYNITTPACTASYYYNIITLNLNVNTLIGMPKKIIAGSHFNLHRNVCRYLYRILFLYQEKG